MKRVTKKTAKVKGARPQTVDAILRKVGACDKERKRLKGLSLRAAWDLTSGSNRHWLIIGLAMLLNESCPLHDKPGKAKQPTFGLAMRMARRAGMVK